MGNIDKTSQEFWRNFKRGRPVEIVPPGPGQESVWDYPRPPAIQAVDQRIHVVFNREVIAESTNSLRVVETAGAPVYYIPPEDIKMGYLHPTHHSSFCEWKGTAKYWNVKVKDRETNNAAWGYPRPESGYEPIAGFLAFYAQKMDACYVGNELVTPQPGKFYGGWVTANLVGPIKGESGSESW